MASDDYHQPPLQVAVVMVPLPAQGHLNQLLHLSRLVAAYNLPVHYVSTATHLRQARLRLHGWNPRAAPTLHFHEFQIPEYESPIPNPNAAIKFPSHLQPLFRAVSHLRSPLTAFLRRLSQTCHRVIVIHDTMMSSVVQDVVTIPNAESYVFPSISAFSTFWFFYDLLEKPFPVDEFLQAKVPSMEDCVTPEFTELLQSELGYMKLNSGNLFNSCRAIEGPFLDLIAKFLGDEGKRIWALGPFNPVRNKNPDGPKGPRHDCLNWLDNQEPKSVIYISFGTTVSFPDEQIKELAIALKESQLKFLWVIRNADRGDFTEIDSETGGFLESGFSEKGIVVKDWAPQLEILGHSAIGGFLTHCGWNSCMESISMDVPMATWPMHSDQPRNAVLITEVLRIGLVVKDWAKRGEIVAAATISDVLRRLMASEEGEDVRRRAEMLGTAVRDAVVKEGREMDMFVAHIMRR